MRIKEADTGIKEADTMDALVKRLNNQLLFLNRHMQEMEEEHKKYKQIIDAKTPH